MRVSLFLIIFWTMSTFQKTGCIGLGLCFIFLFWYSVAMSRPNTNAVTVQIQRQGVQVLTTKQRFLWLYPSQEFSIKNFFASVISIDELLESQTQTINLVTVDRVTNSVWRVTTPDHRWLFISQTVTDSELKELILKPISLQVDYWVLETKSEFIPTILPLPQRGVFILDSAKPTKLWRELSAEKGLPVLPVGSRGGKTIIVNGKKITER